jgi:ferredoxin
MAAIMGIKAEAVTRKVALVRCSGEKTYDKDGNLVSGAKIKANYEGFQDCLAASKVGGNGPLSCKYGCLGFGSCTKACKYGAIKVVNGIAVVDEDLCVGCMACAAVCPRKLIVPVEPGRNVVIACNSMAKGAVTTRGCTVGCIGCGLCKKICPNDAITVTNNLAVIDYSKCDNCGLCATVCPKKLIKDSKVETLKDPVVHSLNNPDAVVK